MFLFFCPLSLREIQRHEAAFGDSVDCFVWSSDYTSQKRDGIMPLHANRRFWEFCKKKGVSQEFAHESTLAISSSLLKVTVLGKQGTSVVHMEDTHLMKRNQGVILAQLSDRPLNFLRVYHPNLVW